MYRERPSSVPGAVAWTLVTEGARRILPDGCMDLVWDGREVLVAGPDTTAHLSGLGAGATVTGIRFAPGTGPAVVGAPAHLLRDARTPVADVWTAATGRRLAERLAASAQPARVLEEVAAARLGEAPPISPAVSAVVDALRAGAPVPVAAASAGVSERQLRRLSLDAFGYGPKLLARVLRLVRALDLVAAGIPAADAAATAGYADQPHLARDVKALAGVPLGALRS